MADLRTEMCGVKFKNPVLVSSNDFGEDAWMAKRVLSQGIGGLLTKTIHQIDGPHRWPRPYFYALRRFGKELRDTWVCSQMFHNMPYEKFVNEEAAKIRDLCREYDAVFIPSVSGIGTDAESWIKVCRDMEKAGADIIELDTGGPHATFGAEVKHKDVGAPLAIDPEKAYTVAKACVDAVDVPVMFKMTPQCINMAELALAVESAGVAAISANNAFYGTWIDHETGTFFGGNYSSGLLIGRAWQPFSLAKVLEITATVKKTQVSGIGGIFTWDDVVRYIMAGCPTVQLCSVIYMRGVQVLGEIIKGLEEFMDRKGYKTIKDFLGICVPEFAYLRDWPREKEMAKISPVIPSFNMDLCNKCGTCERLCPYGAVTVDKERGPVINDHCMGCAWCLGNCARDAVTMVLRETGELVWNGRGLPKKWVKE